MKSSKIGKNTKLRSEIHTLKDSLKALIQTEPVQTETEEFSKRMTPKQANKKLGKQTHLLQNSQRRIAQKKHKKEYYRPYSQNPSQRFKSKSAQQFYPYNQLQNEKQKFVRNCENERNIENSEEYKAQDIEINLNKLNDIKHQLQKLHKQIKGKIIETRKTYKKKKRSVSQDFQDDNLIINLQQKEINIQNKIKENNIENLRQQLNPELIELTDQQLRQNINEQIQELYKSINILKNASQTTNQRKFDTKQDIQQSKTQPKQLQEQRTSNETHQILKNQIIENEKLINSIQINKEKSQQFQNEDQLLAFSDTIQNDQQNSQFRTQTSDQLFKEESEQFLLQQQSQNNTQSSVQANKKLQVDQAVLEKELISQQNQKELDGLREQRSGQEQFNLSSIQGQSEHIRKYTQSHQQDQQVRNNEYVQFQQSDLRDKYIPSSAAFEQNLIYEISCLREENKQLRCKLFQVEESSPQPQIQQKLSNRPYVRQHKQIHQKIQNKLPYQSDSETEEEISYESQSSKLKSRSKSPINQKQQEKGNLYKYYSPYENEELLRNISPVISPKRNKYCKFCDFLLAKGFSTANCMLHGKNNDQHP